MNKLILALILAMACLAGAVSYDLHVPLGLIVSDSLTTSSAKTALRTWLDCFVNADGGTFYDMLPYTAKNRFDNWFSVLSSKPEWKNDPMSASVPTARDFLRIAFEEAKKQGGLPSGITDDQFNSVAETCQLSGYSATFTGADGNPLTFKLENGTWRMDENFANWMVDEMIKAVDNG